MYLKNTKSEITNWVLEHPWSSAPRLVAGSSCGFDSLSSTQLRLSTMYVHPRNQMKQFVWKRVNSWHVCNWGPFRLSVDPPDEHSHEYTWGMAVKKIMIDCGISPSLDKAKQDVQDAAMKFVEEFSFLDKE